jgi:polyisoprenoid-binding protein YceI
MKKLFSLSLFLSVSVVSAAIAPKSVLELNKAQGEVSFLAVGNPSAIKIRGKTSLTPGSSKPSLTGALTLLEGKNITGDTSFTLDSLDTGLDMRNRHMKEKYLETAKFPESKLTLKKLELPQPFTGAKLEKKEIPFTGSLTLHGVTKEVKGTADFSGEGTKANLSFNFKIQISDFGIAPPTFLKISVGNDVTVDVNVVGDLASAKESGVPRAQK